MNIEIKNDYERQELLRALKLANKFILPNVADLSHIEKQLIEAKF